MSVEDDIYSDPKLGEEIVRCLTESLYASGVFSDNDIKDKESHLLALKRILDTGGIDSMTINHTNNLTEKAREYKKSKNFNYARMFYATFFEHQVNELIQLYCLRNVIDNKTKMAIIQSVNIWGKLTWLLQLMNYPKINQHHLNTIKNLADSRNAFVHYKWKDDPDFDREIDSDREQEKLDTEFLKIEKAVNYFKNYCSKIKYNGKKEHIKRLVK